LHLLLQPLHQFLQALQHLGRERLGLCYAADIDTDVASGSWPEKPAQALGYLLLLPGVRLILIGFALH